LLDCPPTCAIHFSGTRRHFFLHPR
jgi:hypothetical protein